MSKIIKTKNMKNTKKVWFILMISFAMLLISCGDGDGDGIGGIVTNPDGSKTILTTSIDLDLIETKIEATTTDYGNDVIIIVDGKISADIKYYHATGNAPDGGSNTGISVVDIAEDLEAELTGAWATGSFPIEGIDDQSSRVSVI